MDHTQRYSRQARFPGVGEAGQSAIQASKVAVVGCGALGTVTANGLVRAGVGLVRIIDRDFVELSNLQRQLIFDEDDVASLTPKAESAARKLRLVNSQVTIEPHVCDLNQTNAHDLLHDVDVIVDGTDNFDTRFLINDIAIKLGKPWVMGSCLGSEAQTMTIIPGKTPCYRCLIESPPDIGTNATCETAGVLSAASMLVGSFQLAETLKILTGALDKITSRFLVIDVWDNQIQQLDLSSLLGRDSCPCCHHRQYDWLEGNASRSVARLCGRNAVQIMPARPAKLDLESLAKTWQADYPTTVNAYLARVTIDDKVFTVFPDGRAIIKGTETVDQARSLYQRLLGG